MWLVTPFGFFSVVEHATNGGLIVRGRAREDVVEFAKRIGETREEAGFRRKSPEVEETPANDYRFRLYATREEVKGVLDDFIDNELDYPNFKDKVQKTQGHTREALYHEVWTVLWRGFQELARIKQAPDFLDRLTKAAKAKASR